MRTTASGTTPDTINDFAPVTRKLQSPPQIPHVSDLIRKNADANMRHLSPAINRVAHVKKINIIVADHAGFRRRIRFWTDDVVRLYGTEQPVGYTTVRQKRKTGFHTVLQIYTRYAGRRDTDLEYRHTFTLIAPLCKGASWVIVCSSLLRKRARPAVRLAKPTSHSLLAAC